MFASGTGINREFSNIPLNLCSIASSAVLRQQPAINREFSRDFSASSSCRDRHLIWRAGLSRRECRYHPSRFVRLVLDPAAKDSRHDGSVRAKPKNASVVAEVPARDERPPGDFALSHGGTESRDFKPGPQERSG